MKPGHQSANYKSSTRKSARLSLVNRPALKAAVIINRDNSIGRKEKVGKGCSQAVPRSSARLDAIYRVKVG
jgi:hypothetical protein